jgi:hypothetical protein
LLAFNSQFTTASVSLPPVPACIAIFHGKFVVCLEREMKQRLEGLKWGKNYREIHFLVTKELSRYRGKKVIAVRFIVNPFFCPGLVKFRLKFEA